MRWVNDTVTLLRKYSRLSWVVWDLISMIALIVLGLCANYMPVAVFSIFYLTMVAWEVSDVYLYRDRDSYRDQLADKNDEVVLLQGDLTKKNEEIEILKATAIPCKENPIKSNRIVSDKTFAVRLLNLMKSIQPCDASSEEELEYFRTTAERLLKWQTKTVKKDSNEYKYLENLGLMPQPSANAEEHTEDASKAEKPKKRPASKRKPKTETTENENQN